MPEEEDSDRKYFKGMKKLLKEPKEFIKEFEKLNSEKKDNLTDEVVD